MHSIFCAAQSAAQTFANAIKRQSQTASRHLIAVDPVGKPLAKNRDLQAVFFTILLAIFVTSPSFGHEAHRKQAQANLEVEEAPAEPQPGDSKNEALAEAESPASGFVSTTPGDPESRPLSLVSWFGRLHPMVVHFPIALFLAALVAELLFLATKDRQFLHALRFCLWGGAISALLAAPLGWIFAASEGVEQGWLLKAHRWAGTAAVSVGGLLLWVSERTAHANGPRTLLRVLVVVQAGLIGGVGFLGGSLLYGIDHLWRGF